MLTKRQKQILDFINEQLERHDVAQTLEEIAKHFRLASASTVHEHLEQLQKKGFLRKKHGQARAISTKQEDNLVRIPLLGSIAAGQPIQELLHNEFVAVPQHSIPSGASVYALKVLGDSMIEENINDGDTILVRHQETAENGQKVVALLDNFGATLKKFYREHGRIRLQPANKNIEPIIVRNGRDIAIQGIVLGIIPGQIGPKIRLQEHQEAKQYSKLPLNQIICGDAVAELQKIPSNSIDLVVTSPPYDAIRTYNGFSLNLPAVGKELYRVLKDGGIAAMVIQDSTKNFGKSLTSFRTILDWCDNAGFKLFETVIYRKYGTEGAWWKHRFRVDHEYMPIFLKGNRPSFFNKEPLKIPSKHGGKVMTGSGNRRTDGTTTQTITRMINEMKCRGTVWDYLNAGDKNPLKRKHPATFPDKIPTDFVQCFCPSSGVVLDPFIGCGSTAVAAKQLGRNYIGIDVSKEYCELTKERLRATPESIQFDY